jgi:hypothetical protein
MRIPGGPVGGQYHGFVGPDSSYQGWPGGRSEIGESGQVNPAGKSLLPGEGDSRGPWDRSWGGTAFGERENHSDYVYRSSPEMRPRPNASGGTNVIHGHQTRRSAGYAVAPGNYRGLGAVMYDGAAAYYRDPSLLPGGAFRATIIPVRAIGPALTTIPSDSTGATSVVGQPAPPISPAPSPTIPIRYLGPPLSLGPPISPAPAPVVNAPPGSWLPAQGIIVPGVTPGFGPIDTPPAPCPSGYITSGPSGSCMPVVPIPCPTGYTEDQSGQCVSMTVTPTGGGAPAATPTAFSQWLAEDSMIPGISNQTTLLVGVLGVALLWGGKGKR